MNRLLIVGGSDAGISAGLRARQLKPDDEVKIVLADNYPNFSICGLPFFISGETPDWRSLAHRSTDGLSAAGLELVRETRAAEIDVVGHAVVVERDGAHQSVPYDRLIVATGAVPIRPPIAGLELPGVHVLHTMADSLRVHEELAAGARSVVIVGGGYIGLEMADAFRHRGLKVTLVEQLDQVMASVDSSLASLIRAELEGHSVEVVTGIGVEAISESAGGLRVRGGDGFEAIADLVLIVVGVRPDVELAKSAGLELGIRGAIHVDRNMRTSAPDVFAAGDCVETWHRVLGRPTYLPLGTTAHKQGRVAGDNAAGGAAEFAGSLGTQVVKVFDLAVARTGLRDVDAREGGFDPLTVENEDWDHKVYYPDARRLSLRITGDRRTGRLLGAQIVGDHRGQVAKRIDIFAAALYAELKVADLPAMDLSYTPPFGAPWDAVQVAADAWLAPV